MKKIFIFCLCLFSLSACGYNADENVGTDKIIVTKESTMKDETSVTVEKKDITELITSFNVENENWKNIYLRGVYNGAYIFYYNNDNMIHYVKYENGKFSNIYSVDSKYTFYYLGIADDSIVMGRTWKDKNEIVKVSMSGEEEILTEFSTSAFPNMIRVGNVLIWSEPINIGEDNGEYKWKSSIKTYDLHTREMTTVTQYEFKIKDSNSYYTGDVVRSMGGWKDGFCYIKTSFHNEPMSDDNSGENKIYYYSFNDKTLKELTDYPYKANYICGNENEIIISDYLVDGMYNTGKVLINTENKYKTFLLKGVNAAECISQSFSFGDNYYLARNDEYIWIFNASELTYQKYKFNPIYEGDFGKNDWMASEHTTSNIIVDGENLYYSVYNKPKMEIYKINIKNTAPKKKLPVS